MYIKKYKLLWLVSEYPNQVPWHKLFGVSLEGVVENLKKKRGSFKLELIFKQVGYFFIYI